MVGQGYLQVGELLLAFALTALVGLERTIRGKGAGMRTQAIVGVASALFLIISKYGFFDVLGSNVTLDPSRMAAQIVSGVGFLGAGLIITQHSRVRGLTTAASVWESAAIGSAAGAGLWLLALVVTALHFVITFGFNQVQKHLPDQGRYLSYVDVSYRDGQGLLRDVLSTITRAGWAVQRSQPRPPEAGQARLVLELEGPSDTGELVANLSAMDGVSSVEVITDQERD